MSNEEGREILLKLLKVKYSVDRKKEFQIKTSIYEKNGQLEVKKEAFSPLSIAHINRIIENYHYLKQSQISLVEPKLEDDYVLFPYAEGISLDAILIEHVKNNELDLLKRDLHWYKQLLWEEEKTSFIETEQFIEIFGHQTSISGKPALKVANIDLNFDNIIINGDDVTIIDYEWVFNFPIPINYVIYRAVTVLHTKYYPYMNDEFSKECMMEYLEIPEDEVEVYEEMEKSFIAYVGRDFSTYSPNYLKASINVKDHYAQTMLEVAENKDAEITRLSQKINEVSEVIKLQQQTVEERDRYILEQNKKIEEVSSWGHKLLDEIKSKDAEINRLNQLINESTEILALQASLEERDRYILEQNKKIEDVSLWGQQLFEESKNKDAEIMRLNEVIASASKIMMEQQHALARKKGAQ